MCLDTGRERERERERRNPRAPFHWIHCKNSIPPRLTNDSLNTASRSLYSHGKERATVYQTTDYSPATEPELLQPMSLTELTPNRQVKGYGDADKDKGKTVPRNGRHLIGVFGLGEESIPCFALSAPGSTKSRRSGSDSCHRLHR